MLPPGKASVKALDEDQPEAAEDAAFLSDADASTYKEMLQNVQPHAPKHLLNLPAYLQEG